MLSAALLDNLPPFWTCRAEVKPVVRADGSVQERRIQLEFWVEDRKVAYFFCYTKTADQAAAEKRLQQDAIRWLTGPRQGWVLTHGDRLTFTLADFEPTGKRHYFLRPFDNEPSLCRLVKYHRSHDSGLDPYFADENRKCRNCARKLQKTRLVLLKEAA